MNAQKAYNGSICACTKQRDRVQEGHTQPKGVAGACVLFGRADSFVWDSDRAAQFGVLCRQGSTPRSLLRGRLLVHVLLYIRDSVG